MSEKRYEQYLSDPSRLSIEDGARKAEDTRTLGSTLGGFEGWEVSDSTQASTDDKLAHVLRHRQRGMNMARKIVERHGLSPVYVESLSEAYAATETTGNVAPVLLQAAVILFAAINSEIARASLELSLAS
jgi:hypothetical protein